MYWLPITSYHMYLASVLPLHKIGFKIKKMVFQQGALLLPLFLADCRQNTISESPVRSFSLSDNGIYVPASNFF